MRQLVKYNIGNEHKSYIMKGNSVPKEYESEERKRRYHGKESSALEAICELG